MGMCGTPCKSFYCEELQLGVNDLSSSGWVARCANLTDFCAPLSQEGIKREHLPAAYVKIRGYLDQQIYIDKTFAEFDEDGSGYDCASSSCKVLGVIHRLRATGARQEGRHF